MPAKIHRLKTGYVPERTDKGKTLLIQELVEHIQEEIGHSLRLIGDTSSKLSELYLKLLDITEFRRGKYVDILGQKR